MFLRGSQGKAREGVMRPFGSTLALNKSVAYVVADGSFIKVSMSDLLRKGKTTKLGSDGTRH